jgi:hypothetical protein
MQQLSLFDEAPVKKPQVELGELFEAYFDCRSNKRNTANAIAFEIDYESNLIGPLGVECHTKRSPVHW